MAGAVVDVDLAVGALLLDDLHVGHGNRMVLIAEVQLNNTDEFGVQLGLQDSVLFDRSLLSDVQTISSTTQSQTAGGAVTTVTQDQIVNANLQPGFNFNNQPLGNNGSTSALATAARVGSQALSDFSLGRVNNDLSFGGLVFSASKWRIGLPLHPAMRKRQVVVAPAARRVDSGASVRPASSVRRPSAPGTTGVILSAP